MLEPKHNRKKKMMAKRLSKKQRQQRQQLMFVGGGMVAAAVIMGIIIVTMLPSGAELPDGVKTKYAGLQQSSTAQGYPQLGDPEAPILVQEFSSFTCPYCKELHEDTISPDLLPLIEQGHVRLVFAPIDLGHNEDEPEMIRAAMCALEQEKFFEVHDVLFHWQGNVAFNEDRIEAAANELGLDVNDFMSCYNSNRYAGVPRDAAQDMRDRGLNISTPTVFVDRDRVDPFNEMIRTVNALIAEANTSEETEG